MAGVKRALVFPGQGSQAVGMGNELKAAFAVARETFEEADEALGEHLSRLMAEGPIDALTLTVNAQPALLTGSIAVFRVLEREAGFDLATQAAYLAGHSLGEYSALVAGRALTFADGLKLVRRRGAAMQEAVPVDTGAMAALLGCDLEAATAITAQAAAETGEIVIPANDNGGGQLVISGHQGAVDKAIEIAAGRGFKKAIKLSVSAPFHSPLMQPAADVMADALQNVVIEAPLLPIVANVTAAPVRDPETIRRLLVEQVTGLVRWRETVEWLKQDEVEQIVEVGTGKVLAGLIRRIDKEIATASIQTPADIEAFMSSL